MLPMLVYHPTLDKKDAKLVKILKLILSKSSARDLVQL